MPVDRKQMQEELEELQLQEAREAAELRKQTRTNRDSRIKSIEAALRRDRFNQERIQAACKHLKGGKGTQNIYNGNDNSTYAVITHTLSHGPTIVVCQRCGKIWEPPAALGKKSTPEQKAKYREDLTEYRRALNFPTDNEPSGTVLFAFTPIDEDAA